MTPTAQDYTWFAEQFPSLREAHCVTLVRGRTPDEVLRILDADDQVVMTGLDSVHQMAMDTWTQHNGRYLSVAVTTVDDYALMVESNGYVGVTRQFYAPLSRGTQLVAHFRNVHAVDQFYWVEDEDLKLEFKPLFADERHGSDPDCLADAIRQVGVDFSEDWRLRTEALFALAEHVTQVRLTPELLRAAEYSCGTVKAP